MNSKQTGHILVIDDYLINRMKLARVLHQQGHTTALAEDGEHGLARLHASAFDVVLLDIMMPGMDGYEVLRRMKSSPDLRDIPVIVISAVEEIDSVVRCIEMGAEDYLPKPFNPVLLRARVGASLQKKKLRDLERNYLQQEMMLRQNEKLATLGKLSAGMAHELNNPAAAAERGAQQLQTAFAQVQTANFALHESQLAASQLEWLTLLDETAQQVAQQPLSIDALTRSDREYELEEWFDDHGVDEGWAFAPMLVNIGYGEQELDKLMTQFDEQLPTLLSWLNGIVNVYSLLAEIGSGAGRITSIVKALKSYAYLDQAPVQSVDVHEGLNDTLIMLRSKLKKSINVTRDFAAALPNIEAYGSELNQVWTNIIDNAVGAMKGQGKLILRTSHDEQHVIVEIEDNGPGIPEHIQANIFDPFFTTKPPGEGTGLGLNISHNIIVQKHSGQLTVDSQPGRTCFRIALPFTLPSE